MYITRLFYRYLLQTMHDNLYYQTQCEVKFVIMQKNLVKQIQQKLIEITQLAFF